MVSKTGVVSLFRVEVPFHPFSFLSVMDPRAVAVSRYGWRKTSYGWLAG